MRLPDEVRLEYEMMVPFSWFPVAWFNDVVTAVATEAGGNVLAFHAEVLHTSAERTVSKLWRVFLRFTSDEALVSRTPLFYSRSPSSPSSGRGRPARAPTGTRRSDLSGQTSRLTEK